MTAATDDFHDGADFGRLPDDDDDGDGTTAGMGWGEDDDGRTTMNQRRMGWRRSDTSKFIKLVNSNRDRKDGEGMCDYFIALIDDTESETGCIIVLLCCDNDGGSHKGRDLVPVRRPWIMVAPCCAHQFNLMLGDYFKENDEAAEIAEQATGLIRWALNHGKVRVILDDVQKETTGITIAFIVANLTRWTTHLLAFRRIQRLKAPLQHAAIVRRNDIIAAQVGAEQQPREKQKLIDAATEQLDLLDSAEFWKGLDTVIEDIEPICLGTNINQRDTVRPDEVILTFGGIFLHFSKYKKPLVAAAMIEMSTSAHPSALTLAAQVTRGSEADTRTRATPEYSTRV
ncbi:hypothetical protein BDZ89DRAFT_1167870 [Hymenopellis radicata]|nr:hypothetical protein BDZ89DRAFT_1167870 [Hymenopellis radicata]